MSKAPTLNGECLIKKQKNWLQTNLPAMATETER